MDRSNNGRGLVRRFRPYAEPVEGRLLLTQVGALGPTGFLMNPVGYHLVRPNLPVAPYGASITTATFVDPTAKVVHGDHVVAGSKTYIGPYAELDATVGFIKIGSGSEVLDNARITASPDPTNPTNVFIGDKVSIGAGATVIGPASIGAYNTAAANTGIGPNAVINGAVIVPGAAVGALAYVGPGVTIPSGYYVLPGASVTTQGDLANPKKVEKIPGTVTTALSTEITRAAELADGYAYLYQGQSATGASPGTTTTGVYNGNLAAVLGVSAEPGTTGTTVTFEPTTGTTPKFPGPYSTGVSTQLPSFPGRVIGGSVFATRVKAVAAGLGRHNSIRGDEGQPLTFKGTPATGNDVTIDSPLGGVVTTTKISGPSTTTTTGGVTTTTISPATTTTTTATNGGVTFGPNFQAGDHAVILGGSGASYTIGSDVSVGADAVVTQSNLGNGVVVGAKSYVSGSTVPAGKVIPPGTVMINNKVTGQVQW